MKSRTKSIIAAIIAFAMIATSYVVALPASAETAEAVNVIINGDFESGSTNPWIIYAETALSNEAHGGSYALCLSCNASYGKAARQTGIAYEANTDYILTFWAKGASGTEGTKGYHAGVYATSGSTKIESLYFGVTTDWRQYTVNFNSGEYTDGFINFSASSAPDHAEVIIDDLVLVKVSEPEPEEGEIFMVVEDQPEFPGGTAALLRGCFMRTAQSSAPPTAAATPCACLLPADPHPIRNASGRKASRLKRTPITS